MSSEYLITNERFASIASLPSHGILQSITGHVVVGDCLHVLKHLPNDSVDLIHTSPPYNIDKPYEQGIRDRSIQSEYVTFLGQVITQIKRVLRPGGSIFWQTGYTQTPDVESGGILPIDILSYEHFTGGDIPMTLWDRIIWRYWGSHAFKRKFTNKHETILWFVKPDEPPSFNVDEIRERSKEYDKRNNLWGRNPGNVWEVDRVAAGSTEQTSHIAVFPEEISEKIIRSCSRPGDLVIDPFSGSGTVPKVARSLGRRWIGVEISAAYANESCYRVGFQQASEVDSLVSGIVKEVAFRCRKGKLPLPDIIEKLSLWTDGIMLAPLIVEFEYDVSDALTKAKKKNVWAKYDRRINEASDDPVVWADSILLTSYRNRRTLNGLSRYRSAMALLQDAVAKLSRPSTDILVYLEALARSEPSSLEIADGHLSLMTTDRRLSDIETGSHSENLAEAPTGQGRLVF